MFVFKNILCVGDLTDASEAVIRKANKIAIRHGSRLTYLNILPSSGSLTVLFPDLHRKRAEEQSRLVPEVMNKFSRRVMRITGRSVQEFAAVVECGSPDKITLDTARELACDLIMIPGDRPAEQIVRDADCPVLIVRSGPIGGCVLAATDLSDPSLPAIRAGAEEARLSHRDFVALFSLDLTGLAMAGPEFPPLALALSGDEIQQMTEHARQELAAAMEKVKAEGEPIIEDGPPVNAILKAADQFGASLIVVGTTGRSGLPRFVFGSVAEAVIADARCSVLAVRLHSRGKEENGKSANRVTPVFHPADKAV